MSECICGTECYQQITIVDRYLPSSLFHASSVLSPVQRLTTQSDQRIVTRTTAVMRPPVKSSDGAARSTVSNLQDEAPSVSFCEISDNRQVCTTITAAFRHQMVRTSAFHAFSLSFIDSSIRYNELY